MGKGVYVCVKADLLLYVCEYCETWTSRLCSLVQNCCLRAALLDEVQQWEVLSGTSGEVHTHTHACTDRERHTRLPPRCMLAVCSLV